MFTKNKEILLSSNQSVQVDLHET